MANNPFDPPIVQVKKTLDRSGVGTVNRGFGSIKTTGTVSRPAPVPPTGDTGATRLSELNDTDLLTTPPTHGQTLVYDAITKLWKPGSAGGGGGSSVKDRRWWVAPTETSWDEFDDDALDPVWVRVDGTGALASSVTWTEAADHLSMMHTTAVDSAAYLHALLRPLSSTGGAMAVGDAFITCLNLFTGYATSYAMGGLILTDGTTFGAGNQFFNLNYTGPSWAGFNSDTRTGNNFQSSTNGYTAAVDDGPVFTRLVKLAGNLWRRDLSRDGTSYLVGPTMSWAVNPTHVGFLSSNWGTATPGVCTYYFLRRVSGVT